MDSTTDLLRDPLLLLTSWLENKITWNLTSSWGRIQQLKSAHLAFMFIHFIHD